MATSYNPLDAIKQIYGLKGDWQTADQKSQEDRKTRAKQALNSWLGNNVEGNYKVSNEDNLTSKFTVPESDVYTNQKNTASEKAKAVYQELRDNGYGGYADKLQGMNYSQAGKYLEDLTKSLGKQEIRPYLYEAGKKYDLTQQDIDSLLHYNEDTNEVSFGGKKIGVATNNIDGHTYWDEEVLQNALNDYVDRAGLKTDAMRYSEGLDLATDRLNEQWAGMDSDYAKAWDLYNQIFTAYNNSSGLSSDYNPYATEWGQAIMANYNIDGSRKSDSEIASGAADNSGNVDSFAAANARRARLSEENLGKQMVWNSYLSLLDRDRANIEGMRGTLGELTDYLNGRYANQFENIDRVTQQNQQIFDNDQTRQNNEVSRNAAIAEITGQIPAEYQTSSNPFFNSDGVLINPNIDYQALENRMQEIINDPNASEADKSQAREAITDIRQARMYKMTNYDGKWAEWLPTAMPYAEDTRTASQKNTETEQQHAYDLSKMGYELEKDLAEINSADTRYVTDKELEGDKYSIDVAASEAQKDRDHEAFMAQLNSKLTNEEKAYVYELERRAAANSDSSTTTNSDSSSTTEISTTPTLTAPQAVDALKRGEISQSIIDAYNYYYGTNYTTTNPPKVGSSNESKSWVENSLDEQEAAMTTDQKVERAFRDNDVTISLNASTGQYSAEPADKALQALNKLGLPSGTLAAYKKKYNLG